MVVKMRISAQTNFFIFRIFRFFTKEKEILTKKLRFWSRFLVRYFSESGLIFQNLLEKWW